MSVQEAGVGKIMLIFGVGAVLVLTGGVAFVVQEVMARSKKQKLRSFFIFN
jgi:hypothetical protein